MAIALEAHGVGKRYRRGRPWALRDVDLAIVEGSITALVGPNGAGKSTLIKGYVGFERPTAGHLAVWGIDPWRDRGAAIRQIGYVPQAASLYRELTVADHLALAARLRTGFDRAGSERRLEQLGIPLVATADELSGGQQAQVGLAIALGTRARVLLLDEPLAALDPLARREFLHVMVDAVRAAGSTALLASHVITDIEQACDRLLVLGGGRTLLDVSIAEARARRRGRQPDRRRPARRHVPRSRRATRLADGGCGIRTTGHARGDRPRASRRRADRDRGGGRMTRFDLRLAFRLQRFEIVGFALLIGLLSIAAVVTAGMLDATGYGAHCWNGTQTPDCEAMGRAFFGIQQTQEPMVQSVLVMLPFLFAGLVGAPLVARELERGTSRLAWSLAPSRLEWFAVRVLPIAVLVFALAFVAFVVIVVFITIAFIAFIAFVAFTAFAFAAFAYAALAAFVAWRCNRRSRS